MHPTLQDALAWLAGAVASVPANFFLLEPMGRLLGAPDAPKVMPDEDPDAWREFIASLEPAHFVGPLVAHWNGAAVGAAVAGMLAADRGPKVPLLVAGFVLLGGVANAFMLPGQPAWFLAVDLAGYIPAGYAGYVVAQHLRT